MKGALAMKRSSYLIYDEELQLGKRGLTIWAYGRSGEYVCRLEINATGLAVFAGKKGGRRIANVNWEQLPKKLTKS